MVGRERQTCKPIEPARHCTTGEREEECGEDVKTIYCIYDDDLRTRYGRDAENG